jgi:hypothetical protein
MFTYRKLTESTKRKRIEEMNTNATGYAGKLVTYGFDSIWPNLNFQTQIERGQFRDRHQV